LSFVKKIIGRWNQVIDQSEWTGLPELTNAEGTFCSGSCPVQAWSHALALELMFDLEKFDCCGI